MKKSKIVVLLLSLGLLMGGISSLPQSPSFNFEKVIKRAGEGIKNGNIKFGSNDFNVNSTSVFGKDNLENTWVVETVGTKSFTENTDYSHIGSGSKPATSITLTCNLGKRVRLTAFYIKFGGFSGTKGTVSIKIGDVDVVKGSLNGTADVPIAASEVAKEGDVISVKVTGIAKGVKLYNLTYSYEEVVMSETEKAIQNISTNNTKAQLKYSFNVTQEEVVPSFVKVIENLSDWSGEYLIVYEEGSVAFDGSLTTLDDSLTPFDVTNNTKGVTISDGKIEATDKMKEISFKIDKSGDNYTIISSSGYYIGQSSNANGLQSDKSTTYVNTISYKDGTINIVSGGAYLRYNAASNQNRFRYYKSDTYTAQKAINLYRLETITEKYTF
ncbi:MAG: hypothetical protein SOZ70_02100, partial [Bacilli bacterium]|nr:hypothetical protein [Bacilli bacterium]